MERLQFENQYLGDRLKELEAEVAQWQQQADRLTGENEALKTEARLQDEQLHQLSPPSADYGQLHDRIQELESENAQLRANTTTPPIWDKQQLQEIRDKRSLLAARDRIVGNWRVAKAPEKKERIKESLDRFIEAITESTQISTPGQDHDTSN